jgi:cytochrome P450
MGVYERFGPITEIGHGPVRFVFLLGVEANEFILSSHHELFEWREAFKSLIPVNGSTSLVVSDGAAHARRRKLVQPAFALRRIEGYRAIIEEEAAMSVDRTVAAGEVDLFAELKTTVRRIAIRTLFGDALGAEAERFGEQLGIAIGYANLPILLQYQRDWPGLPFRRALRATRALDEVIYAEIARRRAAASPGDDLLASLITAADERDALSDEEIRDQVVGLIAGGYETTSALAAWAVLEILRQPEAIDPIRAGDDAYLDGVVNETLRLSTPGPISIRWAPNGFSFAGYDVRPKTRVIWSPSVTQRLPEHWRDPLRFDPTRWLDGSTDGLPPHVFVPFGGGYRRCIGFAMATLEVKVLITELFRRADVALLDDDVEPAGLASMYPKDGVRVRATARAGRRTTTR